MKNYPFVLIALVIIFASCGENGEQIKNPNSPSKKIKTHRPTNKNQSVKKGNSDNESLLEPQAHFGVLPYPHIDKDWKVGTNKNSPFILIVIDAFNPSHLSGYGYHRDTSPNLDALAQDGVLFTNWISNSSWTRPSFTSLITGLTKKQHKVELTGQNVDKEIVTLAEVFQEAGYRTGGFVGNPLIRKIWNFDQGFKTYEDTTDHKAFPRGRILADKAISWIKKRKSSPFFAMLFFTDPHTPYRPPGEHRKYLEKIGATDNIAYPLKEYRKPLPKKEHNAIVAAYDGEISYVDSQVGRIVEQLKAMGIYDNATIVITADHGEMFGEHNCYVHAYHQWESAVRVPFIIKSPALPKGVMNDRPHSHIDLMPSLLEIAQIPTPKNKLGISIGSNLQRTNKNALRSIFSQYNAHTVRRQAARIGRWKLVHHNKVDRDTVYRKLGELSNKIPRAHPKNLPSLAFDGERWELYDLVDDPKEEHNVYQAKQKAPIVAKLKQIMDANQPKEKKIQDSKTAPALSQETLDALKAAGYIQ